MIKRFIVWYLKRHNVKIEHKDYTLRLFDTAYYNRLMQYAETMDGVNCRHCWTPIFDFGKKSGTKIK